MTQVSFYRIAHRHVSNRKSGDEWESLNIKCYFFVSELEKRAQKSQIHTLYNVFIVFSMDDP